MIKKVIIISVVSGLSLACAAKPEPITAVPSNGYISEIEAYKRQEAERNRPNPSLWADVGSNGTIFLDYKARRIGDVVIVKIVETSSASNSSANSTSKSTANNSSITAMMGLPLNFGSNNFLGSGSGFQPTIGTNTSNSHSGQGSTTKSDKVSATIAARIVDIMPSGNLVIEGNREIIIDQEKQTITIRGIVRQKDIDATNVVASTAIADASITYSGAGVTTSATKKGWFSRFLDVVWPF